MLIYLAKGAFLIRSSSDFWNFLISIRALSLAGIFSASLCHLNLFLYLYNQKYSSYSTCSTYFILIFIGIYCILKSFKNEIHFECSPFFQLLFSPFTSFCSVSWCSWSHTIICSSFLVWGFLCFCHFWEDFLTALFACVFAKNGTKYLVPCKLIFHTLLPVLGW